MASSTATTTTVIIYVCVLFRVDWWTARDAESCTEVYAGWNHSKSNAPRPNWRGIRFISVCDGDVLIITLHSGPVATTSFKMQLNKVVIVWSACHFSETESVTALICSSGIRTEPNTGYSHLLACSSVTYRGQNAAHIHFPFDDITCNISTRH